MIWLDWAKKCLMNDKKGYILVVEVIYNDLLYHYQIAGEKYNYRRDNHYCIDITQLYTDK